MLNSRFDNQHSFRAGCFAVSICAFFTSFFAAANAFAQSAGQPLPSLPPPAQTSSPTPPPVYAPPPETLPTLPQAPPSSTPPATLPPPSTDVEPLPLTPPPRDRVEVREDRRDKRDEKKASVGLDLMFTIPVGRLSDSTGVLIGPMVKLGYRFIPRLEVTARAGYLFGFNRSQAVDVADGDTPFSTSQTVIPAWVGASYFFMRPRAGLHADLEVGLNLLQVHFHGDLDTSDSETTPANKIQARFGFNAGVGYVLSEKLPIDFRVQCTYFNVAGNQVDAATGASDDPFIGISLSAGYSLAF